MRGAAWWLAIFAAFLIEGAWPSPDENETVYLAKARYFADPSWCAGDAFLQSADAHWVFYALASWPTHWLSLDTYAWAGRLATWALMALSWGRMGSAAGLRPGSTLFAAAVFITANHWGHLSGEWVVGGFESKGVAYAVVWLAWADGLADRWRLVPVWLGLATAIHPLVGIWQSVAMLGLALGPWRRGAGAAPASPRQASSLSKVHSGGGIARTRSPNSDRSGDSASREQPRSERGATEASHDGLLPPSARLRTWYLPLAFGLGLAAVGIVPAWAMNSGVSQAVARQADAIYVRLRLPHHLVPTTFDVERWRNHSLLVAVTLGGLWLLRSRGAPGGDRTQTRQEGAPRLVYQLGGATGAALLVCLLGLLLADPRLISPGLANRWLRLYWFRLGDVVWPLALALTVARLAGSEARTRWRSIVGGLCLLCLLGVLSHGAYRVVQIARWPAPRSTQPMSPRLLANWRDACRWARQHTPPRARFFTPRLTQTFKWYAGRPEVVNWKDLPQDAEGIVEWWRRIEAIHLQEGPEGPRFGRLTDHDAARWHELARRFSADYLLARSQPPLGLPRVYANEQWTIYRFGRTGEPTGPAGRAGTRHPAKSVSVSQR